MTEPVSNADVEDVLSSIRRLVSDNKRPASGASDPQASDRLILSPNLRVAPEGVLRLQPEHAIDAADQPDTPKGHDGAADVADETPSHSNAEEVSEATITGAADDALPPLPNPLNDGEATGRSGGKASRIEALTAKIAALETAIARTSDQWEPDGNSRDDYSGTQSQAMAWQDSVELDATGAPVPVETQAGDNSADAGDGPDREQLLDEQALRDLVSDIVRSELQGALGERITRNVRKLVRREIHRALAAKELE
ncbi:hypothetical protein ACOTTU_01135 [Roseobacter sp. EG26]|uniref:hypothetical protein n=1 Tax=Roseobacter sp. EG26 TaxID=3412477 RepID=UPI0026049536|nr:hypothetical protein [uncultured Roseobacter sp.]